MNYYDESCKGFEFWLNRKRNKALSINNKNNNSIKWTHLIWVKVRLNFYKYYKTPQDKHAAKNKNK